jgi:hypothetical protein
MWTVEQQQLVAKCDALRRNDPQATTVDLGLYGPLSWEDAVEIAAALQHSPNTRVKELRVVLAGNSSNSNANSNASKAEQQQHNHDNHNHNHRLCHDGALPLSHFVRHSPSLTAVSIVQEHHDEEEVEDDLTAAATAAANKTDRMNDDSSMNTSILLDAISHRPSHMAGLTKLTLTEVDIGRPSLLETVLSTTKTLAELDLTYQKCPLNLAVTQALRRGLSNNTTLRQLQLVIAGPAAGDFVEEIISGLLEHATLKVLVLDVPVTAVTAQVLRCLLQCNQTMRVLDLTPRGVLRSARTARARAVTAVTSNTSSESPRQPPEDGGVVVVNHTMLTPQKHNRATAGAIHRGAARADELPLEPPDLRPILEGLANNRGLKDVSLHIVDTHNTQASAWTEMLQHNKSMVRLELHVQQDEHHHHHHHDNHYGDHDSSHGSTGISSASASSSGTSSKKYQYDKLGLPSATAIAKGLGQNSTLQSLHLVGTLGPGAFHGPTWQDTLQRNQTLQELSLSACHIGNEGVAFVARAMSQNKSLKLLDLTGNSIGNTGGIALTRALTHNRTLEALVLARNALTGPESGTAVNELLLKNKCLKRMDLCHNQIGRDGGAAMLAKGLSRNKTLETLDLENNTLDSAGFKSICDSLRTGSGLKVLVAEHDDLFANDCDRALREMLGRKALRIQDVGMSSSSSMTGVGSGGGGGEGGRRNRSIAMGGEKGTWTQMLWKYSLKIIVTILLLVAVAIAWIDRSGYYVRISWFESDESTSLSDGFPHERDLVEERGSEEDPSLEF